MEWPWTFKEFPREIKEFNSIAYVIGFKFYIKL